MGNEIFKQKVKKEKKIVKLLFNLLYSIASITLLSFVFDLIILTSEIYFTWFCSFFSFDNLQFVTF